MCFAPAVSLTTAIVQWVLALVLVGLFRSSKLARYLSVLMIFLGGYQFTEFMLCVSSSSSLWAHLGFVNASFLPAIGVFALYDLLYGRKLYWVFVFPVLFILYSVIANPFVLLSSCERFFIVARNLYHDFGSIPHLVYTLYYAVGILVSSVLCILAWKKSVVYKLLFFAVLLFVVPTFVLIVIVPSLALQFPSILCQFAVLFSAVAVGAVLLERKEKNKHSQKLS